MSELLSCILTHDAFRKNRLPSLYSDFSLQKNTNSEGYAVNIAAWEGAFTDAARKGCLSNFSRARVPESVAGFGLRSKKRDHLVLKVDDALLRELEIPGLGRPVALGNVFDEAIHKHTMIPLQLYRSNAASLNRSRWRATDLSLLNPWGVMGWGIKQLKGMVIGIDSPESSVLLQVLELVLVDNVKEAANRVMEQALKHSASPIDLIYSKEKFVHEFSTIMNESTELSDTDFDILLLYLSRDSNAAVYDGKTIKLKTARDTSMMITQQDTTIASMKTLISNLSIQVAHLEQKIMDLTTAAKIAVNNKNRLSALSILRSKKLAESNLKQRLETLAQLEQVYSKIEQAADQVEIVRVMEASTEILRGLHAQVGGVERVEDIVEELREEMTKVDEIGNIINEVGLAIDEAEIDDELKAMEVQEVRNRENADAEATRRRLAGLDEIEQAARDMARTAGIEQPDIESALAMSTEKLSQMSMDNSNSKVENQLQGGDQLQPAA